MIFSINPERSRKVDTSITLSVNGEHSRTIDFSKAKDYVFFQTAQEGKMAERPGFLTRAIESIIRRVDPEVKAEERTISLDDYYSWTVGLGRISLGFKTHAGWSESWYLLWGGKQKGWSENYSSGSSELESEGADEDPVGNHRENTDAESVNQSLRKHLLVTEEELSDLQHMDPHELVAFVRENIPESELISRVQKKMEAEYKEKERGRLPAFRTKITVTGWQE